MSTFALLLAWLVVFSWILPLVIGMWMIAKGGREFLADPSQHRAAAKEIIDAIPGLTAITWVFRLAGLTLAVAVLAGSITGLCS